MRFLRETVTAIDPEARRVTTDGGIHEADYLVVALGADYDFDATPGLAEAGNEFYSVAGAERLAGAAARRSRSGRAVIGVCGAPFKCPPAPSECALLLARRPATRGVRDDCEISLVMPFGNAGAALARDLGGAASRRSPSAASSSSPAARVSLARPASAASQCSTTAASCRSTSSSACRSTARPTSCSRAG